MTRNSDCLLTVDGAVTELASEFSSFSLLTLKPGEALLGYGFPGLRALALPSAATEVQPLFKRMHILRLPLEKFYEVVEPHLRQRQGHTIEPWIDIPKGDKRALLNVEWVSRNLWPQVIEHNCLQEIGLAPRYHE